MNQDEAAPDLPMPNAALDRALATLPQEIAPQRDLWATIAGRLEPRPDPTVSRRGWLALAASVVCVGFLLLIVRLLQPSAVSGVPPGATLGSTQSAVSPVLDLEAAPFGRGVVLDAAYVQAHRDLSAQLRSRLARLPPQTRRTVEENLAVMRHAAMQINTALEQQPGDPLLEELLLKAYQDELTVMSTVYELTRTDADAVLGNRRLEQL
jgi:hypothetical protein